MDEFFKENIRMIKNKATGSIHGLIRENIKGIGLMENSMDLENTLLLKKNQVAKKLKR